MPRDYKRVLDLRAEAASLGVDADQMIMDGVLATPPAPSHADAEMIMEASHG